VTELYAAMFADGRRDWRQRSVIQTHLNLYTSSLFLCHWLLKPVMVTWDTGAHQVNLLHGW